LFENLRRDARRYLGYGGWWRHLGFWAGTTYRLSAWASACPVPVVRRLLMGLAWMYRGPFRLVLHLELPYRARIGPGLLLEHPYNVLVGAGVEIGADCSIFHEVTLGEGPTPGLPRLGDGVVVFPGAKVFGGVTIGERSEIGANCVITRDVPAHSIVMTPPPRPLPQSLLRRPPGREASAEE
jgi:serine O-acetyltransferase